MKLIDLTCSKCGASLQVNPELTKCMCQYCGNEMLIDNEVQHHSLDNGFEFGYQAEMGRQQAQQEMHDNKPLFKVRYCDKCGTKLIISDLNAVNCICPKCNHLMQVKKLCKRNIICEHCNKEINSLVDYNDTLIVCPFCEKTTHFISMNKLIESKQIENITLNDKRGSAVKYGIISFIVGFIVNYIFHTNHPIFMFLIGMASFLIGIFVDIGDSSSSTENRQLLGIAFAFVLPVIALPYYTLTTRSKYASMFYWFSIGIVISSFIF